ncbi:hypothetical protein BSKO_02302 [Bryopsis sp. KO-2023]|nr:hypothetical protein BSKO_02302 [Bryopsis sp. KO-2023]
MKDCRPPVLTNAVARVVFLFVFHFVSIYVATSAELAGSREAQEKFRKLVLHEPRARLSELARISDDANALTRTFLSPAHRRGAKRIAEWMEDAGLKVWIDIVGNVHGRTDWGFPGAPAVFLGSHYDTVLDAGEYDGTLGILASIAAVKYLDVDGWSDAQLNKNVSRRYPVEIVAFSDEEGARFQSTFLGSKALSGSLLQDKMLHVHDAEGLALIDVLKDNGMDEDLSLLEKLAVPKELFKAYVEIHSEQGPKLSIMGSPLGVVSGIAGQTRLQVSVLGDQNHAGTVPMPVRKDALVGAAEIIHKIEQICKDMANEEVTQLLKDVHKRQIKEAGTCPQRNDVSGCNAAKRPGMLVCTVGQLSVWPGASNVIPGSANFTIDVRSGSDDDRDLALLEISREIGLICAKRGLNCDIEKRHDAGSVKCDPDTTLMLEESAEEAIETVQEMLLDGSEMHNFVCRNSHREDCRNWNKAAHVPSLISGAGHDALVMNEIGPVGMVFVRDNGISHSPKERIDELDIAAATMTIVNYLKKEMEN